jgi:hypothetical protein
VVCNANVPNVFGIFTASFNQSTLGKSLANDPSLEIMYIYIYICIHIQFCPGFLVFERCTRVVEVCANAKRGLLKSNLAEEAY